jgi:GNAT superfamily N-acetyltransferase
VRAAFLARHQGHPRHQGLGRRRLLKVRQQRNATGHIHEAWVDDGQPPAQRLEDSLLARPEECLDARPECGLHALKVFPLAFRKGNRPEPLEARGCAAFQVHADPQYLPVGRSGQQAPVSRPAQARQYGGPGRAGLIPRRSVHVVIPGAFPADVVSLQGASTDACGLCGLAPQRYASGQEPVPLQFGTERRRPLTFAVVQSTGLAKVYAGQHHSGQKDPVNIWFGRPFHTASGRVAALLTGHWNQQPILRQHSGLRAAGLIQQAGPSKLEPMSVIRPATPADVPVILQLIHELAVYEKEPEAVRNTPEMLAEVLFGSNPRVYANMAENEDGEVRGFALWFLNYSTWEGVHGIYLEDLYVTPEARGEGHGKALLQHLAATAVERGYARVEWSVLDWNEPSINFYRKLGAFPMEEWSTFRLTGTALAEFGSRSEVGVHG